MTSVLKPASIMPTLNPTEPALYRVALTRSRGDQRTRGYLDRRTAQGMTRRQAIHCLTGGVSAARSTTCSNKSTPQFRSYEPLDRT
jgi:hypothetical protein